MGRTLEEIAKELRDSGKQVQLIYAFNGVGKTRLSRTFKELIAPKQEHGTGEETATKIIYYNAFTEDLFYWDNDLDEDVNRKLKIRPNSFTRWVLEDEGQANNIISLFQHYTNNKLTPRFNNRYDEVFFSIEGGNDERVENIKVSKGEESCFIWCVFYSLLREIVNVLNIPERENRSTNRFDDLEYVFIDDPVSSLDENHLIELAVNIAETINSSKSKSLKFIITTHNPLFYNIAYNELNLSKGTPPTYMLENKEDGLFEISEKKGDSNKSFSYHLFLKQTIKEAIDSDNIQKFHFTLLRNLYEKTANFLGYPQWSELLPEDKKLYHKRIIQFSSHSTLSNEAVAEPNPSEKRIVEFLFNDLIRKVYWTGEKSIK